METIKLCRICFHIFFRPLYFFPFVTETNFVGSFDVGEYVLFFFRETAVEFMNCGKAVYSRVARVCKHDTGGKHILSQNWATYLKARLNCSIPGEFPFYFDEIRKYDLVWFHFYLSFNIDRFQCRFVILTFNRRLWFRCKSFKLLFYLGRKFVVTFKYLLKFSQRLAKTYFATPLWFFSCVSVEKARKM